MPHLTTDDGVKLFYQETGAGIPIVFVHEFAGDHRCWEPQVRYFGRRYRCITYNARGYPPSDVPAGRRALFAGPRARRHPRRARRAQDRQGAHRRPVDGRVRHAALRLHLPDRARSLVVAGCGYGAAPDKRAAVPRRGRGARRKRFETLGMAKAAKATRSARRACSSRTRTRAAGRSSPTSSPSTPTEGSALTMRGVQKRRPSLYELVDKMQTITAPTLIMTGDEDWPCLEPALLMKRTIPTSGLVVMPNCRPSHQPRGAGRLQPPPRRLLPCRRRRRAGPSAIRARWRRRSSAAADQHMRRQVAAYLACLLCAVAASCIVAIRQRHRGDRMSAPLSGKAVLVTGASAGIGRASRGRARAGGGEDHRYRAPQAASSMRSRSNAAAGRRNDRGRPQRCAASSTSSPSARGDVDILVNNAGILKYAPLMDMTDADCRGDVPHQRARIVPGHAGGGKVDGRAPARPHHRHDARSRRAKSTSWA